MKVQKIIATIVAIAISSAGFAKEIATRPNAVQASKSFNSKVFDVDNNRKIQAVELSKQEMQETEGEFLPLVAIGLGTIAFGMWIKHGESYAKTGEPASIKEVTKAGAIDGATAVMPGGAAVGTVKKVKTVAKVTKAVSNTKKTTNVVNNTSLIGRNITANNANASNALNRKLNSLEKAQKNAVKTKFLPDGRIRYYDRERPARTTGATRGNSIVTEYNPKNGNVRQWAASFDHFGNVNRVHPKSINGQTVNSPHYPPTQRELKK